MTFHPLITPFRKEFLLPFNHFNKCHSDRLLSRKELPLLPSFVEEIDKFQFEKEAIVISEAEEEADEYSYVQTPVQIVTYISDSSDEEEEMAPKTDPSLRELMKSKNKAPSPQDKNKSKPLVNPPLPPPPPPQLSTDLRLKPNPDLRRKRHIEALEEGEMTPSKASK